jgi:hypothetical protein
LNEKIRQLQRENDLEIAKNISSTEQLRKEFDFKF